MKNETEQNTILIFTTRQLCYSSAEFFAARLAEALEDLGYQVEMCEADTDTNTGTGKDCQLTQEQQHMLEQYIGKSYLAVIDINSRLPRMMLEDGSYYLDQIHAPFYNYILDNPLYHHESLSQKLKDYHVILVDQNHCAYVEQYYPHIRSVIRQTLGASTAVFPKTVEQKRREVLFMGTFRNPEQYYKQIKASPYCNDMQNMIDLMLADSSMTMQSALEKVLADKSSDRMLELNTGKWMDNGLDEAQQLIRQQFTNQQLTIQQFALRMNLMHPVELYMRNRQRKAAIDALAAAHIPLRIVGEWWDGYRSSDSLGEEYENVNFEPGVTFARSFDKIAGSAILLDSAPFFKAGIHDRVFAGMANQTAVLTDYNQVKADQLKDCVTMYDPMNPTDIVYHAEELLTNPLKFTEVVDNGLKCFKQNHTWMTVAKNLAEQIEK